jgi:hypothetical protein
MGIKKDDENKKSSAFYLDAKKAEESGRLHTAMALYSYSKDFRKAVKIALELGKTKKAIEFCEKAGNNDLANKLRKKMPFEPEENTTSSYVPSYFPPIPKNQGYNRNKRTKPIIISKLDSAKPKDYFKKIIPNSRGEGGIEKAFSEVANKKGGLVGVIGGCDFFSTLASNGQFSHAIGFDINPYQVMVGAIRFALLGISDTPFQYLSNLLSFDLAKEHFDDFNNLHDFFESSIYEEYSEIKKDNTWNSLEPILKKETATEISDFKMVWEKMSERYMENAKRKNIITGEYINVYLRDLQEVNLRKCGDSVSWLATQKNYDKLKLMYDSGNIILMKADLFKDAIEKAESYFNDKKVKFGTLYISNVPSYANPSDSNLNHLNEEITRLENSNVFVTDGSSGRGMSSKTYMGK